MKELFKGFALAYIFVYGGYWIIRHYNISSLGLLYKSLINNFGITILSVFFLQVFICLIISAKNFIIIKLSNNEFEIDLSTDIVSKCIKYIMVSGMIELLVWISYNQMLKFINVIV